MSPMPAEEKMRTLWENTVTGNTLSRKGYEYIRKRAPKNTGWSTVRVDAWIAEKIEEKETGVGKAFPRVGTKREREITIASANQSPQIAQQAITKKRVTQWISKRCNTDGPSSAHIHQMKENLRQGTKCPIIQIEATLVLLAAEEGMKMECRSQGKRKTQRDWIREAAEWAAEARWEMKYPTARTIALAKQSIATREGPETVIVELGSGWLGATEGLQKVVTRVIQQDEKRQTIARVEGKNIKAAPDILSPFQSANPAKGPIIAAARVANVNLKEELVGTWISPSCRNMSTAQGFQKGKSEARGPAAGMPIPEEDVQAIEAIVNGLKIMNRATPKAQWAIENPERSAMWKIPAIEAMAGSHTKKVHGCAYGRKSGKTYKIAMSKATYDRFQPIHPTDRESLCEPCKRLKRTKHKEHEQAACPAREDPRPRISEEGQVGKGAANRVPPALAEHVGRAMLQAWQEKVYQRGLHIRLTLTLKQE